MRTPQLTARPLIAIAIAIVLCLVAAPRDAAAYPFWAQETAPETPREATGRIACANCHLAEKPVEIAVPQSVLPDTVFKAVVEIPYDHSVQQVVAGGDKGGLNVGAVLMLPDGFRIAPEERIPEEWREEIEGIYYQPYSDDQENVILVGPMSGDDYQEIVFPILSPDPRTDKNLHFGKYPIHLGGNRGRGQLYPTGEKSNNAMFESSVAGTIREINFEEYVGYDIAIETESGEVKTESVPAGPELIVAQGDYVEAGQALTEDPNVGGFGQEDTEIVLQSQGRVFGLMLFIGGTMVAQMMLILKKKQVERVQASEMDF